MNINADNLNIELHHNISENKANNILRVISPIIENDNILKNDDPQSDIHHVAILSGN